MNSRKFLAAIDIINCIVSKDALIGYTSRLSFNINSYNIVMNTASIKNSRNMYASKYSVNESVYENSRSARNTTEEIRHTTKK